MDPLTSPGLFAGDNSVVEFVVLIHTQSISSHGYADAARVYYLTQFVTTHDPCITARCARNSSLLKWLTTLACGHIVREDSLLEVTLEKTPETALNVPPTSPLRSKYACSKICHTNGFEIHRVKASNTRRLLKRASLWDIFRSK